MPSEQKFADGGKHVEAQLHHPVVRDGRECHYFLALAWKPMSYQTNPIFYLDPRCQ